MIGRSESKGIGCDYIFLGIGLGLGLVKRFICSILRLNYVNNTVPFCFRYVGQATNDPGDNVNYGSRHKEIQGPIRYLFVHFDAVDNSKEK